MPIHHEGAEGQGGIACEVGKVDHAVARERQRREGLAGCPARGTATSRGDGPRETHRGRGIHRVGPASSTEEQR